MSITYIITWIVIGLVAGFLAGLIRKGKGFGWLGNFVVGISGSMLGGFLFRLLHIKIHIVSAFVTQIVIALIGALILLFLIGLIFKK